MKYHSQGTGPPPEIKYPQVLFVDIWKNWTIFEDYYGTFDSRLKKYIEFRKNKSSHFNENFIAEYKRAFINEK